MQNLRKYFLKFFMVVSLPVLLCNSAMAGDIVNIDVGVHESKAVSLPQEMTNILIGNRNVAGVVKNGPKKVTVTGHSIGKTDVRIMNGKKIVRQINVNVSPDMPAVKKSVKNLFPGDEIGIEVVNDTVALTGSVSSSEVASQIVKVVGQYVGNKDKVINLMKLKSGQQVMLRVRVGEMRREELKKLGLGLHGIISSGSAVFGALERDGLFKVLAEPTLTAISGESAEFLAGGEFPIPVPQPGNVMSVEYKSFGVSVNYTPIVLSQNRIRLSVASEVSDLQDAKKVGNVVMPSISTRRANTTVELAPGESFMIAGLISDNSRSSIHKVPGLGDIPILSPLFRSAQFQRNETELVISVTPYLASPAAGDDIRMPTDNFEGASMLEMLFLGNLGHYKDKDAAVKNGGPEGSIGYMVD